ncbi:MAG: phytoene desaturase family protein [Bacteroidetes bacterium]|nr:phytoene desaturase family protein [Bacteroidota bacterium]MCY4204476.1 phytoene desaturase family protein [Bacteroidota bacterium]
MPEKTAQNALESSSRTGYQAVVIGGGFGGLTAAVRLQAAGVATTLIEQRGQLGGRAGQICDSGYTFDTGPSLITAPPLLEDIFQAAGRCLKDYVSLVPLDPFYRVWFHDGTYLDYTSDLEQMKSAMAQFDQRDADRLDTFFSKLQPIYDAVIVEGLGARPFDSLGKMIAFTPRVVNLGAWKPVSQFVRQYFRNWRHHFLYSFHPLFLGGSPFRAPSIFLMIPYLEKEDGVWYAYGGMYSLVKGLAQLFTDIGGKILLNTSVLKIETDQENSSRPKVKGVCILDSKENARSSIDADIVVSNADVGHTYAGLLGNTKRRRWTNPRVSRIHQSMSCFLLYLGVRKKYPKLSHHTIILGPRYKGLVQDIFDRKKLSDDFSMYLHVPSRTEPDMAPPGGESIYILVPVPNLASGTDWKQTSDWMADQVITALEAWGLEDLRNSIEVQHAFTPADFESEYNSTLGNAFGIEPRITQTAWFRPHNRSEDVDGLYLVGAGTHPGAGVPGVVLSASATMYAIREDYKL